MGGEVLDVSFRAISRFGHVVSALGWGTHALAPLSFRAGTYWGVFTLLPLLTGTGRSHHDQIMAEAARLVESGKLASRVDPTRFDLASSDAAHERVRAGLGQGRVIVEVVAQTSSSSGSKS